MELNKDMNTNMNKFKDNKMVISCFHHVLSFLLMKVYNLKREFVKKNKNTENLKSIINKITLSRTNITRYIQEASKNPLSATCNVLRCSPVEAEDGTVYNVSFWYNGTNFVPTEVFQNPLTLEKANMFDLIQQILIRLHNLKKNIDVKATCPFDYEMIDKFNDEYNVFVNLKKDLQNPETVNNEKQITILKNNNPNPVVKGNVWEKKNNVPPKDKVVPEKINDVPKTSKSCQNTPKPKESQQTSKSCQNTPKPKEISPQNRTPRKQFVDHNEIDIQPKILYNQNTEINESVLTGQSLPVADLMYNVRNNQKKRRKKSRKVVENITQIETFTHENQQLVKVPMLVMENGKQVIITILVNKNDFDKIPTSTIKK